jgi:hypothetical protein
MIHPTRVVNHQMSHPAATMRQTVALVSGGIQAMLTAASNRRASPTFHAADRTTGVMGWRRLPATLCLVSNGTARRAGTHSRLEFR